MTNFVAGGEQRATWLLCLDPSRFNDTGKFSGELDLLLNAALPLPLLVERKCKTTFHPVAGCRASVVSYLWGVFREVSCT